MKIHEKNIDAFLELIIDKKYKELKIEKYYKYKKVRYRITLRTNVDWVVDDWNGVGKMSLGPIGVYITFIPHRNEIVLQREDLEDDLEIESEALTSKYIKILEKLHIKKMNDNVSDFITISIGYLELKSEHRNVKIDSLDE